MSAGAGEAVADEVAGAAASGGGAGGTDAATAAVGATAVGAGAGVLSVCCGLQPPSSPTKRTQPHSARQLAASAADIGNETDERSAGDRCFIGWLTKNKSFSA